ncbi:hypothetical protein AOL_s00006g568 [Orbilia oligospora ATCC 24927]|uniref:GPI inositol-deacylase winged helix domain-containing protein n=1 Tax=Arthrobotrys oligospora (strain ATCC 24927 / CBS 115.81 / DSM 1491) TaxID=756982 RepID=G1X117_ARTOA|nr:hypothetical protein AOL_s00006g568 [Orbilia oligospora ATCC 24927]EGX53190.1 hypothetical protein AOL_s00006g568 [Orbilia oligospora ATCC 24927]
MRANRRLALNKLPGELYGAFEGNIDRTKQQVPSSSDLALDILMWVHLAEKPLHVNELLESLALKIGDGYLNTDHFPSRQSRLDCCLGLVIVEEETSTVCLVHLSLQAYLHSRGEYCFKHGHEHTVKAYLTYLRLDLITASLVTNKNALLGDFPFLDYTACQWGYHMGDHVRGKIYRKS